jgi:hypothetical protein
VEPSAYAIKVVAAFQPRSCAFLHRFFIDRAGFAKTASSTERRIASRSLAARLVVSAGHDLIEAGT